MRKYFPAASTVVKGNVVSSENLSREYIDLLNKQRDSITLLTRDENAFAAFIAAVRGDHRSARIETATIGGEILPDDSSDRGTA